MTGLMLMLVVYLLIALGFSFLCSILEAVVLSITPAYVAARMGEGRPFGRRLERLKQDIDRPLAAILTLNTFAHTIGAAGVGAQAQRLWGEESLTVVSAVVTLLILVGSEIIPKTLGAVYWQRLAHPAVATIRVLTVLLLPFVWMSQLLTRLLRHGHPGSVLSRSDIRNVVEVAHRDGILRRSERAIIKNLMGFQGIAVEDIMTPRKVVVSLDETQRVAEVDLTTPAWLVSRIPIYAGDLDHVTGYVLKDEILTAKVEGHQDRPLSELARSVITVRADLPIPELYTRLVEASEHIAMVVDADGRTVGLVTMEDLIETMLGLEILDEADQQRDLKSKARETWKRRARASGVLRQLDEAEGRDPP